MRKFLSILLIAGLLCSLCACGQQKDDHIYTDPDAGGMIGNGDTNTTTPSDTENKTENTENSDEISMKAERGDHSLKYPVSESGIKSLMTFYECKPADSYKSTAYGKIYRNNAGNIVFVDNRDYFAPINFYCEISEGKYKITFQYSVDGTKIFNFDGDGILLIQLKNTGLSYSNTSMLYDISQFVIISEEDKLTEMVKFNESNVDFNQTVQNDGYNKIEISNANIEKMTTFKEATPNDTYANMYPDATTYINEAKNVIIFDTRSNRTKFKVDCIIDKNEDGEPIFKLTISGIGKEQIIKHKGYGVYKFDLSDAGYIGMYATMYNSTDAFTK